MTDRIKTTLRLPESLHKRFDEGNMNADIVARLEASFEDEWKDRHMSANELIESVEMPAVLRVKGSGNAHDDMSRLCELVTSMPVEMVALAMDKQKHLVAVLQLPTVTLVADQLCFMLNSTGRVEDMNKLIACLDLHDLLVESRSCMSAVHVCATPQETLDRIFTANKKQGLGAIRELCQVMNPAYSLDV